MADRETDQTTRGAPFLAADEWMAAEQVRLLRRIQPLQGAVQGIATLVAVVGVLKFPYAWQSWTMLAVMAAGLAVFGLGVRWRKQGRTRAASHLHIVSAAVMAAMMAILFEGLIVSFTYIGLLITVLTSVLISIRAALIYAATIIAVAMTGLVLAVLDFPDPSIGISSLAVYVIDVCCFLIAVFSSIRLLDLGRSSTQKALEQLLQLNEELEQRVAARTAELQRSEKQLQRSHDLLEQRVAERTAELAIMLEATQAASSTLQLDKLLALIARKIAQALNAAGCSISYWEQEQDAVVNWVVWRQDLTETVDSPGTAYALSDFPATRAVLETHRPVNVVVSDPRADPAELAYMRRVGTASLLMLPLIAGDEVIGLVEVDESTEERVFTPAEIHLCQALASQAATAIENARLYEDSRRELTERVRAEARLKSLLEEKEVLLKEIHHRVKNNLQVISSMLRLQSGRIAEPHALSAIEESQQRIQAMSLIHETLYQSPNLEQIDFADYVQRLTRQVLRAYLPHQVQLEVEVAPLALALDKAVPCGLIIHELVSNALKHAFPAGHDDHPAGGARIEVGLRPVPAGLALTVSDNGVGLPAELDLRQVTTLGLQLVATLVDQLEGSITLERGNGTAFTIIFAE